MTVVEFTCHRCNESTVVEVQTEEGMTEMFTRSCEVCGRGITFSLCTWLNDQDEQVSFAALRGVCEDGKIRVL